MAARKAGDRWIVEFMFRGNRIFRRLPKGRTKADAQALESKLRHQIFDAIDLGKLPDPLLEKLIDEWLETRRESKAQKQTAGHSGIVRGLAKGARLSECTSVADRVRSAGTAPATTNRRLCVLKAVAKYAYQKGYCQENLSPKIQLLPEKTYQARPVNVEDITRLLDAARSPRAKALIALGAFTGMRLGEILKLTPENVSEGFIHVRDAKNGEDRFIPVTPEIRPHLGQLPFGANWRNVYRGWEVARKRAGLKLRFHDLRHIAATTMAESGDTVALMSVMGWKSVQTARRYIHPSLERKAELMGRIPSALNASRKKVSTQERKTKAKK